MSKMKSLYTEQQEGSLENDDIIEDDPGLRIEDIASSCGLDLSDYFRDQGTGDI